ncbi:hypothetical protein NUU61_008151 [Penicillium alfredii]|uniref:Uncharacterized protein n=1 Tax=Penicillium alfredii TaxID=1506179 RepID=A0A9W9ES49_9EURO|nr:uncharacterized protein NUU61_008151 [Penicillium alfredii]KAJ5086844.1 hypothetical protein NUU61_008151 [Penicillium alfredii]
MSDCGVRWRVDEDEEDEELDWEFDDKDSYEGLFMPWNEESSVYESDYGDFDDEESNIEGSDIDDSDDEEGSVDDESDKE